jgi:hypothetical protein
VKKRKTDRPIEPETEMIVSEPDAERTDGPADEEAEIIEDVGIHSGGGADPDNTLAMEKLMPDTDDVEELRLGSE